MSHQNHDDDAFFREVDEDYRRDQAIKFFEDYGAYFLAGAFVILALVAGYNFQQNRRAHQAAAGGDALSNAMVLAECRQARRGAEGPGHARRKCAGRLSRFGALARGGRIGCKK